MAEKPQAEAVPLDAAQVILDGAPTHQSTLLDGLITGQGFMGKTVCQKSVALPALDCITLTAISLASSRGVGLTIAGHVGQTRKETPSLSKDELLLKSSMTGGWILLSTEGPQSLHPHPKCLKLQRGK